MSQGNRSSVVKCFCGGQLDVKLDGRDVIATAPLAPANAETVEAECPKCRKKVNLPVLRAAGGPSRP